MSFGPRQRKERIVECLLFNMFIFKPFLRVFRWGFIHVVSTAKLFFVDKWRML
jgi:hypothetical protein